MRTIIAEAIFGRIFVRKRLISFSRDPTQTATTVVRQATVIIVIQCCILIDPVFLKSYTSLSVGHLTNRQIILQGSSPEILTSAIGNLPQV
jgi:hypothetical protein